MKYSLTRDLIFDCTDLNKALNILIGEDKELRRHLESLLLKTWEEGYETGYQQSCAHNSRD